MPCLNFAVYGVTCSLVLRTWWAPDIVVLKQIALFVAKTNNYSLSTNKHWNLPWQYGFKSYDLWLLRQVTSGIGKDLDLTANSGTSVMYVAG